MYVVGCDFSSLHIDLVRVHLDDLEPPKWNRYSLMGHDAFDRTRTVGDVMPGRASDYWSDVIGVGIEHPAGKFGVGPMMRVQGAVLACLPSGVMVKAWPPGAWRKAVGLAGNATKEAVADWAHKDRFPPTVTSEGRATRGLIFTVATGSNANAWPQDACDAYCIALATRGALERQAA